MPDAITAVKVSRTQRKKQSGSLLNTSTMNLATPAPNVEKAVAEKAAYEDAAIADQVQQSEPVRVSAAGAVDPALPYDDPMRYAPAIVANPREIARDTLSVATLRGTASDFESEVAICRGAPEKNIFKKLFPMIFDERDFATYGELKKYCLVKGDCCFVYGEKTDPKPHYALPLDDFYPIIEDRDKPDKLSITVNPEPGTNKQRKEYVTVLMKDRSNKKKQVYQFTFNVEKDPSLPKRFADVVSRSKNAATKRRPVTASVVQAKRIGKDAEKAQPMI